MNMESTPAPSSALPSRSCPRCLSPIPERAPGGLCPRCLLDGANAPTDAGLGTQSWKTPTLAEIASAFPELEVLGHLGTGGMGCVYRVRERDSGRISALKVLPRELAADPAFVERFEREARTLSRLRHPHIVGVHGFGQAGGFCFLLMEFVDGANLRQALQSGRFTPQQALALIPPICEALQAAHAEGVLHRDIKPDNIMLSGGVATKARMPIIKSGAVSPSARAMPMMVPVRIPGSASGRTWWNTTCTRLAPTASAAAGMRGCGFWIASSAIAVRLTGPPCPPR